MKLKSKKILLGVTAGIAAYKAAILVRLLVKNGAEVKVIMTKAACDFITPLTLSTLSKNPVYIDFFDPSTGEWTSHVELGMWGDVFVIAPATANEIAKMANGLCDNLLTATYLSAKCPTVLCPAMDLDMYAHKATQENLSKLLSFGNHIIEAESGELASGLIGQGRMSEPESIVDFLIIFLVDVQKKLSGKVFLVTAGPTREPIDPVRYISNHSSGKMGYAIAHSLAAHGAKVHLVSGPVNIKPENIDGVEIHQVSSASEMFEKCKSYFSMIDGAIFAAAVADYSVKNVSTQKIKKDDNELEIQLVKNPDIAYEFGKIKRQEQISVGFALETQDELNNAKAKLVKKNFDFVVLNSTNDENATFGYDTNKITIVYPHKNIEFGLKSKNRVAEDIVNEILKRYSV